MLTTRILGTLARCWTIALAGLVAACAGGESVEDAAAVYLSSLADGTADGYLRYQETFSERWRAEQRAVPSNAWPERERQLREQAKSTLRSSEPWRSESAAPCHSVVRSGAVVTLGEMRRAGETQWEVFYEVSYDAPNKSPIAETSTGKLRFFRSGTFRVQFSRKQDGSVVAGSVCSPVPGSSTTWPVPELSQPYAENLAHAAGLVGKPVEAQMNNFIAIPQQSDWTRYLAAGEAIQAVFRQHGWTLTGFEKPSMGWYSWKGGVTPPASWRPLIVREVFVGGASRPFGWMVTFLAEAKVRLTDLNVKDDTAQATYVTTYSGCTSFCELWKDLAAVPYYGALHTAFYGDFAKTSPLLDLNKEYVWKVDYSWTPATAWEATRIPR